jgi:hypothetical protein
LTKTFFQKTIDICDFSCYNNDRKKEREEKEMRKYFVSVGGTDYEFKGYEAAYQAYHMACDFAETLGLRVDLWDGETGEVLASSDDEE